MTTRGVFVSDLHLLSQRSVGHRRWDDLRSSLRACDLLVLGGDIFDFRWRTIDDYTQTLATIRDWIERIAEHHRALRIVYVLGNHDSGTAMQSTLRTFANESPHFTWEMYAFRMASQLFVHGDTIDAGPTLDDIERYRAEFAQLEPPRGVWANQLYNALVATRAHRLPIRWLHTPSRVMRRLHRYIRHHGFTADQGVQEIFLGHTHAPFSNRTYRDQVFHNAGSGIRHLSFTPQFFPLSGDLDEAIEVSRAKPTTRTSAGVPPDGIS